MLDTMLVEKTNDELLAIVGAEADCKQVAALAQAYDATSLLVNCFDQVGESQMPSSTALEMASTQGGKYRAFAKLAKSVGWTNVAVLNFVEDGPTDYTYHDQLLDSLSSESITLDFVRKGGFSADQNAAMYTGLESVIDVILETYLKTRIYIIILQYPVAGTYFMNVMSSLGLLETGKYFVVMMGPVDSDSANYFSFNTNRVNTMFSTIGYGVSDSDVRQYYRSFLYFTDIPHYPKNFSDEWTNFQKRVDKDAAKSFCPPICDTEADGIANNDPWSEDGYWYSENPSIVNAYDMGRLLSETVSVHGASILRNPSALVETMSGRGVTSLLGYVTKFDANRVSQREYILWAPQQSSSLSGPIPLTEWATMAARMLPDGKGNYSIVWKNLTQLGIYNGALPKSKPACGFNSELCPASIQLEIILIAVCVVAIVLLVGVIAYIVRWIAYERRLESSYFLVHRKHVQLVDMTKFGSSRGGSIMQSAISMRSQYDDPGPVGNATMNFYTNGIRKAARRSQMQKSDKGPSGNRDDWLEIVDWHLAKYDNTLVIVRKINKTQLKLTREMKQEIDLLMNETHENLNRFFGLINESDLIFTIHHYGPRKSLMDLLRNDDLRLDRMFRVSFVEDVIKGLQFLHEGSKIGYHGNLKSSNCIVDAYWRIKLSSYGMEQIRADEPESKPDDLLWFAPEIIRRYAVKHDLSKIELAKADIYSFSIILYEIYGRQGPFGDDLLDSDEIIEQLKFPDGGALTRPDIHLITKAPYPVSSVVEKCWAEDPDERPNIKKVKELLKPLSKGLKGNIADNIMNLLDRYRNNLEDVIRERTEQLEDERIRNENLLLQLLPKSVANSLKNGQPVEAEFYDSVSIYFSDIVGFTSLSSKSTPLQIVNMLNSLYTNFDTIIDKFDCYKVETIGDAYMFVSGLPDLNSYLHAGEVAAASLELLDSIKTFTVSHCPDEKLRLRIGNHSGPVVTGVVGIRMPRYCLFGDTVIIANNMESGGEPMRIQISSDSYELILKCGGYVTEQREKIILKNKMEVMTYWMNDYSKDARLARLISHQEKFPHLEPLIHKFNKGVR
ncbi:CRE-GCY-11 protein [Caenorhabditis remanei]|uniref:guanylate cyclase n=1 Tax=Caenorhabditis remanei TaxID=31234 RepID=E3MB44_CAERE|nr:CRE-GCY-11 protein [Caenorhabditis remanei]